MESRARVQEIKKKFETLKSEEEKNNLNNKNIRGQVKRSPAFRSCKFSLPMKSNEFELTDTLRKKLDAPLPKGPAPQKPPRTFAHSSRFPDGVAFTRSKTEPHIMLKKIESALLKNQSQLDRPGPKSLNGFSVKTKNGNCLSFVNCNKEEPVYTEPYAPKIQNDQPQRPKTLHYMSSPITLDPRFHNGVKPKINSYEDNVKNLQVKMLEPFNNNTETDSDGDSIKIKHAVEERKIYAKRNCSIKNFNNPHRAKSNMINALLLIGIDYDDNGHLAYIKERFPSNVNIPDNFARLVFPDAENWKTPEIPERYPEEAKSNNYTIFITASDGSRSYAYCRRIQPEGSPVCLPLAYAILTDHRPNTLYYKVLDVIESKHGVPKSEFNKFIHSLLEAKVPKFNESLIIGDVRLNRCIDEREESTDISTLLKTLSVPVFIQILSCLLLERKVILVGSFVSLLSTCIEGLLKSLHPFTWQHTIISILPISMSEILEAPTPYIIGLIKSKNQNMNGLFSEVEDVIVCDIDKGKIIKEKGDENSILPEKLSKALHAALYLVPVRSTDVAPSEALLRLFVELVGHYNNHLISSVPNKNKRFQKENFVKAPAVKSVRLYLEWFVETALFHHFIRERTERTNDAAGLFERKCAEHVERQLNKSRKGLKINFF